MFIYIIRCMEVPHGVLVRISICRQYKIKLSGVNHNPLSVIEIIMLENTPESTIMHCGG